MATSRVSNNTISSNLHDRRIVQSRIRALQQRTNALYESLSRSSSVATGAIHDIERAYSSIIDEFREQRDQLRRRVQHAQHDLQQTSHELDGIRRNLQTAQSFHLPQSSPRQPKDTEAREMNVIVDDIERLLNQIGNRLKQHRFVPSNSRATGTVLGKLRIKNQARSGGHEIELSPSNSFLHHEWPTEEISVHKLYTIDLDKSAAWIIASIEGRIFACDVDGYVRIFSYARDLRRQPLLTERFRLSTVRLISSFTVTRDYLMAYEHDTQLLTLHTHHGALHIGLRFPYDPIMIVTSNSNRNQIWSCSRSKRQCIQFDINHNSQDIISIDEINLSSSVISDAIVDPVGISCDEKNRVAIHDANVTTTDRVLLFGANQNAIITLDFIKYVDRTLSSSIERVLFVPNKPNLFLILYAPRSTTATLHEIVIIDLALHPSQVIHRLTEPLGVQGLDLTPNGEIVYSVCPPANKRSPPKMHVYHLNN